MSYYKRRKSREARRVLKYVLAWCFVVIPMALFLGELSSLSINKTPGIITTLILDHQKEINQQKEKEK